MTSANACVVSLSPSVLTLGRGLVTMDVSGAHLDLPSGYLVGYPDSRGDWHWLGSQEMTVRDSGRASFTVDTSDPSAALPPGDGPVIGKLIAWSITGGFEDRMVVIHPR